MALNDMNHFVLRYFWLSPFTFSIFSSRENFGYINNKWTDGPSMDQKFVRKRAMQIKVNVQCGTYGQRHNIISLILFPCYIAKCHQIT